MSGQLYFPEHHHEFKDEGECKHCGIRLSEEFQHRHYSDIRRPAYGRRRLSKVHAQGVCVVCWDMHSADVVDNRRSPGPPSSSSRMAIWGVGKSTPHRGFGFPDRPFAGTAPESVQQQIESSAEDAFYRTLVLLEHAAGILLEELLPALEEKINEDRVSAG